MSTSERLPPAMDAAALARDKSLARRLTGVARWWVVLETTGRRSRRPRHTPLAPGPVLDGAPWLIAVHGQHSSWVKNIEADSTLRVRIGRAWLCGTASVEPFHRDVVSRFNLHARTGQAAIGIDPVLIQVDLHPGNRSARG